MEKHIEKKCCDLAEAAGWKQRKFTSPGRKGVVDRFFFRSGRVVFMEFKDHGEEPRPLQVIEMDEMIEGGLEVYWIDSVEEFKSVFQLR